MSNAAKQEVDLVLTGGIVVTMNETYDVFEPGAVAVAEGSIVAVGPAAEVERGVTAREVVDCSGQVIMPGLINAHTHVPMSLLRGLVDDLRLDVWLYGYMLPVEHQFVSEEFCHWGTLLSCAEMIRSGVTTFADMYYFEDAVAEAVAQAGMRAVCAETIMKLPTPDASSYDESLEYCRNFIERWRGHPLITPAVGPHAPYTCTPEILERTVQLAREYEVPLLIHLSETAGEVEDSRQENGFPPVMWVDRFGVLSERTVAAHCVHVTEEELRLLAHRGVGVVHNPTSNLKLASGVANVVRMRELGVKVGLGTDGSASNNDQDMFEEVRLAALLPKGTGGDPTAVPARVALAMGTREGAQALHMGHLIGSLEPGKRADVIVVGLDELHSTPRFHISQGNIYSLLVYSTKSADVRHVLVDGRWLMRDRELLTLDVKEVIAKAQEMGDRINSFLVAREEDVVNKLLAVGGEVEQQETFEVQVKVRVPDTTAIEDRLRRHPDIQITKHTVRDQYDTYFLFADVLKGRIRYREDDVLGEDGEVVESIYTLTLTGPVRERQYENSVVLSRSRYTAAATRSLRFYREYFQPDEERQINKRRRRYRIRYKEVDFAINLDKLVRPAVPGMYLEIKSRTWSKNDAVRKAELIGELLDLLEVDRSGLLMQEYVDFPGTVVKVGGRE